MPDIFTSPTTTPPATTDPTAPIEHHIHAFSSFCQNPVGIHFQTQEADETILLFLRRDPITNIPWIFITIVFLLLPTLISAISAQQGIVFDFLTPRFTTLALTTYYAIVFTYAFVNFISWFFNISLVTNKRVVDIDFTNLLFKDVAGTSIALIQDVDYIQGGIFQTFFDYGDVRVQTETPTENFDFLKVPKPLMVTQIILPLIQQNAHDN